MYAFITEYYQDKIYNSDPKVILKIYMKLHLIICSIKNYRS